MPALACFATCNSEIVVYSQIISNARRDDIVQAPATKRACTIPLLRPKRNSAKNLLTTDNYGAKRYFFALSLQLNSTLGGEYPVEISASEQYLNLKEFISRRLTRILILERAFAVPSSSSWRENPSQWAIATVIPAAHGLLAR
jgi:hypothetical protein